MNLDIKFYWKLFLKRLPYTVGLFMLCSGIGLALAVKLPTTYSTQAVLLVEAPEIRDVPGAISTGGIGQQMAVIQQRLLTRANLIDIANRHRVFGLNSALTPDEKVSEMRRMVQIGRSTGRNRASQMTIRFDGPDPRMVANVVNDFVTLVLEENVRLRTGLAESQLSFFSEEVERLEQEVQLKSEAIVAYKNRNAQALPGTLNYRMNRETLLQERISRAEREIGNIRDQKDRLISIFEATGRVQAEEEEPRTPEERSLAQLQRERDNLLLVYSTTSPRVRVVQAKIDALEKEIAAKAGATTDEAGPSQESLLEIALSQLDGQLQSLEANLLDFNNEVADLRASIEATAANEIQLNALERDYRNAVNQLNNAMTRLNQAQVGEQIELTARGQRFTVIDQATVPNSPSSPNRPVVAMAGVGAGIAAMMGLFVLLELLNRTARRPAEITKSLGITPIATIPYMETRRQFWIRRIFKLAVLVIVIVGVPIALWAVDTYYQPLDLIYDRILKRVGLG